jgi:hypothetical protein
MIDESKQNQNKKFWIHSKTVHFLLLGIVIFCAHFLLSNAFGIYEDDIRFVHSPFQNPITFSTLPSFILEQLQQFISGRPIGFIIPALIVSTVRWANGTLLVTYLVGFLIIYLNALLFYVWVNRFTRFPPLAFLTAVIFTLFPADTTHLYLTHNLSLQYAMTWLILAFIIFPSKQRWLSYILSALVLFTYESPYWLFLAAPIFVGIRNYERKTKQSFVKSLFCHFLVMAMIFLVYFLLRYFFAEKRVIDLFTPSLTELSLYNAPFRIVACMTIGPFINLSTFLLGPIDAINHLTVGSLILMMGSFVFFIILFDSIQSSQFNQVKTTSFDHFLVLWKIKANQPVVTALNLLLMGFIMFPLAHTLSFSKYPEMYVAGRLSSVNMASAIPGALVIAPLVFLFWNWASQKKHFLGLLKFLPAFFLSLLMLFRYRIQLDFRLAHQHTQQVNTQVIEQVEDVGPNTLIFVDTGNLANLTSYIQPYQQYLNQRNVTKMVDLPPNYNPKLIMLANQYDRSFFHLEDGNVFYDLLYDGQDPELLVDEDVIWIRWDGQRFVRQVGEIKVLGQVIKLKPLGTPTLKNYETLILYDWFYNPAYLSSEGPIVLDTIIK